MCRPGVVDCTTGRAYPGFCKPLCGGGCDPFIWVTGDCSCDCKCTYKCGYTPYGGRTICGDDMAYVPSCVAPPLRWAAPAVPSPPSGHVVHLPPCPPPLSPKPGPRPTYATPPTPAGESPPSAPTPEPEPAPTKTDERTPPENEEQPDEAPVEGDAPSAAAAQPRTLHDARNDRWQLPRL